jgi:hypothetical protein
VRISFFNNLDKRKEGEREERERMVSFQRYIMRREEKDSLVFKKMFETLNQNTHFSFKFYNETKNTMSCRMLWSKVLRNIGKGR